MPLTISIVALFTGCSPCLPLSEVPLRGGTPASRDAVRRELLAIEQELSIDVCIHHVRLDAGLRRSRNATYDPLTHGIRLGARLAPDELGRTLRHEVCHGIDLQNDLVRDDPAPFVYGVPPPVRQGQLPNEAFADTCELGRDALAALGPGACTGDPDLRAAWFVRDVVFRAVEPGSGAAFEPIASYTPAEPGDAEPRLYVRQAREPGQLVVRGVGKGAEYALGVAVDAFTGELVGEGGYHPVVGDDDRVVEVAPPGWDPSSGGSMGDDPAAGVVSVAALDLPSARDAGERVWRGHVLTEQGWGVTAGPDGTACVAEQTTFFTFDGELWSGALAGETVFWGRWVPEPP